jgi:hypothetical protein
MKERTRTSDLLHIWGSIKMEMDRLQLTNDFISTKIHFLRSEKVLLDSDLAFLYGVPTKVLKQAVKRNIDRFPEDFMFQLSNEEWSSLRSQFATLKADGGENLRSQFATSGWGGQRLPAFCLHRTRCRDAVGHIEQQKSCGYEHRHHADFCCT